MILLDIFAWICKRIPGIEVHEFKWSTKGKGRETPTK